MDNTKYQGLFRPIIQSKFRFRCHKDIQCFTQCCAALDLVLTPYDVVRLKNCLAISSDEFLDRYTETRFNERSPFPMVYLKMGEDRIRKCPFVTREGCTIYEHRPGACRIYPLGRATLKVDREREVREKFFVVQEEHCLGFEEEKEWTVEEWMAGEGVNEYNRMNDEWLEIITARKGLGPKKDIPKKIQMFYLASYNLDTFRRFLFKSRFFHLFQVASDLRKKLASDDTELMRFAFDWLKFSLLGEKTLKVRSASVRDNR